MKYLDDLEQAYQNEKTSIILLKAIYFIFVAAVLLALILIPAYSYGVQDFAEALAITTITVLFVVSLLWDLLLVLELVKRARIKLTTKMKSQAGWILVDSMLGVLITVVALTAILGTCMYISKSTVAASGHTAATYIAQQRLDQLNLLDGSAAINPPAQEVVTQSGMQYRVTTEPITLSTLDGYYTNPAGQYNLSTYQITVSWPYLETGNEPNNVRLIGYYYVKTE
ncbi:hypothetical protein [Sporomusa termitida]|uniref:Uncharacterized protein n=1 Tax=Sporomusa termitida TaxID=2377 RepID=A0A517DSJ6_9FIRM|nr:hypothetical protein [Sporomusa termitida]QDR80256.1 hypothetical protein SPTER_15750 [Sporomusa termitida]